MATTTSTKRPSSVLERQFEFPALENWRKGQQQKVQSVNYKVHNRSRVQGPEHATTCSEFTLKEDEVFSFGPQSRFIVTGQFQVRTEAAAEWTGCEAGVDGPKVVLVPNWFEMFIKDLDIFHGNTKLETSKEARFVSQYINTWKYCWMSKDQKKLLCPDSCHPGHGVPTKFTDGWTVADGSEWRKYAETIFLGTKAFTFSWIPLDVQPFFQYSNYFQNGNVQKFLPMPILSQLLIRFNFLDNQSNLFKLTAGVNQPEYRFLLKEFTFVGEHMKLNKSFQAATLNRRGVFNYPGVTRVIQPEIIPQASSTFKSKVQAVPFPEGLFIFCLPKDVASGNYKYQNNTDGSVFVKSNIDKVAIAYGDETLWITDPNLGTYREPMMVSKLFTDMLFGGAPFGLNVDANMVNIENIKDGFENGPFPLVYINLTNFGDRASRVIPFLNDGSCLNKDNDLDITFTFNVAGSEANVTYYICLFYTDINLTLDTRKKGDAFFTSPYIKKY